MAFVSAKDTRTVEVEPGLLGTVLIDGSAGSRAVTLLHGVLRPGARHSCHYHDMEEAVVFLSGRGVVDIGGHCHEVGPGDSVWIPPRAPHGTENNGTEELRFVAAFGDSLVTTYPVGTPFRATKVAGTFRRWNILRWAIRRSLRIFR